jgi:hypothetical protein
MTQLVVPVLVKMGQNQLKCTGFSAVVSYTRAKQTFQLLHKSYSEEEGNEFLFICIISRFVACIEP